MYKIYIKETPLFLVTPEELDQFQKADDTHLVARYPGKPKLLLSYVDMLEKTQRFDQIVLYHEDLEKLAEDFMGHFTIIEAAGGVVANEAQHVLAIFRRGYWDLPKGKIEPGEATEVAAVREVEEETGLQEVELIDSLAITYHTYRDKKEARILKRTFWYSMRSNQKELIPQLEEDIEQAVWMSIKALLEQEAPIFGNIKDILNVWKKNQDL